jgi:hypothetical protein
MSTAHTPGPWELEIWDYDKANPPRKELTIQNKEHRIAVLDCDFTSENPYTIPKEQAYANAHLMIAAPELLAMLADIANVMPDDEGGISLLPENVNDILQLIAKARGER